MDVLAALIPSVVVVGFFIALLVTALRATDKPRGAAAQSPPRRQRPDGADSKAEPGRDAEPGDS